MSGRALHVVVAGTAHACAGPQISRPGKETGHSCLSCGLAHGVSSHKLTAVLCLQLLHKHTSPQHKPQNLAREAATLASAKHSNILQYLVSLHCRTPASLLLLSSPLAWHVSQSPCGPEIEQRHAPCLPGCRGPKTSATVRHCRPGQALTSLSADRRPHAAEHGISLLEFDIRMAPCRACASLPAAGPCWSQSSVPTATCVWR